MRRHRARIERQRLMTLTNRVVKSARQEEDIRQRRGDHGGLRGNLASAFHFRRGFFMPSHR